MSGLLIRGLLGWSLMVTLSSCDAAIGYLGIRPKAASVGLLAAEEPCDAMYESPMGKVYFYLGGNEVSVGRRDQDLPVDQLRARARQAGYFPCEHIYWSYERGYYYYDRQGRTILLDPAPTDPGPSPSPLPLPNWPVPSPIPTASVGVG